MHEAQQHEAASMDQGTVCKYSMHWRDAGVSSDPATHLWAWTLPLSNVDALSLVTAPVAVSYAGSLPEADAAAA